MIGDEEAAAHALIAMVDRTGDAIVADDRIARHAALLDAGLNPVAIAAIIAIRIERAALTDAAKAGFTTLAHLAERVVGLKDACVLLLGAAIYSTGDGIIAARRNSRETFSFGAYLRTVAKEAVIAIELLTIEGSAAIRHVLAKAIGEIREERTTTALGGEPTHREAEEENKAPRGVFRHQQRT